MTMLESCSARCPAAGALKAVLGLGPSFFASAYHAFLEPDQVALIAFLAAAPAVIVVSMSGGQRGVICV